MKLPKSKMIKGEKWLVRFKWNLRDEEGNECYGLCDFSSRTIFIDRLCPMEMRKQVFFHECLHAVIHELCIDIPHAVEESIVEGVERWVFKNYKLKEIK